VEVQPGLPIARPVQRLLLAAVACLLAATGGTLGAPAASAGGDQLRASGVATYTLDPARTVVHVSTVYTLVNRAPGGRASFDCSFWAVTWSGATYLPRTCTRRTGQSFTSYPFWTEMDAVGVRVRASSGPAQARRGTLSAGYRQWSATFRPIRYGETRRLTVTYDLPGAGPRPAAGSTRRASAGYADFCASGPTSDVGATRVVVPSGYALVATPSLAPSPAGATQVYASARIEARPWEFELCLRGPNPEGSSRAVVAGPGGSSVDVVAWNDDVTWRTAVTSAIGRDLVALEGVLGPMVGPLPSSIHETTADDAGPAPIDGSAWALPEWITDPASISSPLAHGAWLPEATFGDGWVRDGTLAWARTAAGLGGVACEEPTAAPAAAADALDLDAWVAPARDAPAAVEAAWAYKRQAACYVVSEVALAAGDHLMRAALDAIRDGWDAWSPADAPVPRSRAAIGWRDWLDIVTERALVPAGADPDLAARLLATYDTGIDPAELEAHRAARMAYHRHLDRYGSVPASVTDAMRRWAFEAARAGLGAADEAAASAASVAGILPGIDVAGGPVEQAIRSARTQADLDGAIRLAATQVAIARDVAAAFALEAAPRDALQELGLAGSPSVDHAIARSAVQRVDADAARTEAARITALIDGAGEAGLVRAALIVAVVVGAMLVVVSVILLWRRRRRGARTGSSLEADGAAAGFADAAQAGLAGALPDDTWIGGTGAVPGTEAFLAAPPSIPPSEAAARVALAGAAAADAVAGRGRDARSAEVASVPPAHPGATVAAPAPAARTRRYLEPPTAYRASWPGDAPMPDRGRRTGTAADATGDSAAGPATARDET
jgi:hypothetical protein